MGLPAGGVMGIKLAHDADGLVRMDVVKTGGYLWSITDNGLAKATLLDEYPTQGRYGQGVINMRLPKDASEVAAAVTGAADDLVVITTATGNTKKIKIKQTTIGSRHIKPRAVLKIGMRNRITGAVRTQARPEQTETAVLQQMSLLEN